NAGDVAHALGVSSDGSKLFVTGQSDGGSHGSVDYATIAYDAATGAELWLQRYNRPGRDTDIAFALGVGPGGVFVTGSSVGSASGEDYATIAYDAASGAQLWLRRYN